jgi:hypothetical protein
MLAVNDKILVEEKPYRVMTYRYTSFKITDGLAVSKVHIPFACLKPEVRNKLKKKPEQQNTVHVDDQPNWPSFLKFVEIGNDSKVGFSQARGKRLAHDAPLLGKACDMMIGAAWFYRAKGNKPVPVKRVEEKLEIEEKNRLFTVYRDTNIDNEDRLRGRYNIGSFDRYGYRGAIELHSGNEMVSNASEVNKKEAVSDGKPNVYIYEISDWAEMADTEWIYSIGAVSNDLIAVKGLDLSKRPSIKDEVDSKRNFIGLLWAKIIRWKAV